MLVYSMKTTFYAFFLLLSLVSCGSKSKWQKVEETQNSANPRYSAYAADGFTFSKKTPERDFIQYEFYYKKCHLVTRDPFPTSQEHQCTDP